MDSVKYSTTLRQPASGGNTQPRVHALSIFLFEKEKKSFSIRPLCSVLLNDMLGLIFWREGVD